MCYAELKPFGDARLDILIAHLIAAMANGPLKRKQGKHLFQWWEMMPTMKAPPPPKSPADMTDEEFEEFNERLWQQIEMMNAALGGSRSG